MKSNITISIDAETRITLNKRDVNVSQLINEFLLNYLMLPLETKDDNSEKMMEALKQLIEKKIEAKQKKKVIIKWN